MLAYTRVSEIKCMLLFLVLFSHFSKIFKFLEKLSSSQETTLHGKNDLTKLKLLNKPLFRV